MNAEQWRNRRLEVRVFEFCTKCEKVQPDVKTREHYASVYSTTPIRIHSCGECFKAWNSFGHIYGADA
ncbi:hypothetical protein WK28_01975 [Burkholderia vietnamiensis]|nr:hypothetical protein WK28_01975 [Burkholderia vietnamiensis]